MRFGGCVIHGKLEVMLERPPSGSIPTLPGSYQFFDAEGRIIYVGKAKSLRHRLSNYFQPINSLPLHTAQMIELADRVEWTVVGSELEALILEYTLIQRHKPRFNVRLRDDKSYPWLAISVKDEWPRPMLVRGVRRPGIRYFGPYAHVGAVRETLDLLIRIFPVRTCSDAKFKRHERLERPCLLFDIERCSGPCIGAVEHDEYATMVDDLMKFLMGDTGLVLKRLNEEMNSAADALEFEKAALSRDRIEAVRIAAQSQQMVSERNENIDVFGIDGDELEVAVSVLYVRNGRVVGRNGYVVDRVEDLSLPEFLGRVVEQFYGVDGQEIPNQILVPLRIEPNDLLGEWLSKLAKDRGQRRPSVSLVVPKRGPKHSLQLLVTKNATQDLNRHRLRRASDYNSRTRALVELQEALGLVRAPLRIECYDMSHLQGTDYVGSMVVFEDGAPKNSDYRRFKIKTVEGNDDYAAMEEVLSRRLKALMLQLEDSSKVRSFSYTPELILIDGGKGQLGVVQRVLESFNLADQIELASLAKRFEEVFRPNRPDPIVLNRGTDALYLLQRIRDEAHRFAITFHRSRRTKRMTSSVLDGIEGLGPNRQARLRKEMGGIKTISSASLEELRALTWLPDKVAVSIYARLHGDQ